jgi:hypothetical protein
VARIDRIPCAETGCQAGTELNYVDEVDHRGYRQTIGYAPHGWTYVPRNGFIIHSLYCFTHARFAKARFAQYLVDRKNDKRPIHIKKLPPKPKVDPVTSRKLTNGR